MHVKVRGKRVGKALAVLNKKLAEDGDLRRFIEKSRGHKTKGQKRREAYQKAVYRQKREARQQILDDI